MKSSRAPLTGSLAGPGDRLLALLRRCALAPAMLGLALLSAAWGYGWPEALLLRLEELWDRVRSRCN